MVGAAGDGRNSDLESQLRDMFNQSLLKRVKQARWGGWVQTSKLNNPRALAAQSARRVPSTA